MTAVLTFGGRQQEIAELAGVAPRKCLCRCGNVAPAVYLFSDRIQRKQQLPSSSFHSLNASSCPSPPLTHQCAFTQSRNTANNSASCPSAALNRQSPTHRHFNIYMKPVLLLCRAVLKPLLSGFPQLATSIR